MAFRHVNCTSCGIRLNESNTKRAYGKLYRSNIVPGGPEYPVLPQCKNCIEKEYYDALQILGPAKTQALNAIRYDIPIFDCNDNISTFAGFTRKAETRFSALSDALFGYLDGELLMLDSEQVLQILAEHRAKEYDADKLRQNTDRLTKSIETLEETRKKLEDDRAKIAAKVAEMEKENAEAERKLEELKHSQKMTQKETRATSAATKVASVREYVDDTDNQPRANKQARDKWNDDNLGAYDLERLEQFEREQLLRHESLDDTAKSLIKDICWYRLYAEKARKENDPASVEKWQRLATQLLENEKLLKKQDASLPMEKDMLDGFIRFMENHTKIGQIDNIHDLFYYLFYELPEMDGLNMPIDAAHQVMLSLENNARMNNGLEPITELPPNMRIVDGLKEFMPPDKVPQIQKNTIKLVQQYIDSGYSFEAMDFRTLRDE